MSIAPLTLPSTSIVLSKFFPAISRALTINEAYAGINDVNAANGEGGGLQDDTRSFFFAETLKYIYLTFYDPENIA